MTEGYALGSYIESLARVSKHFIILRILTFSRYNVNSRIYVQGFYPEKSIFWWADIQVGLYPRGLKSGMDILLEPK